MMKRSIAYYLLEYLEDDVAGEVHEADVGGAAGAVVVDAVDDAPGGVVDGAAAAVEHQRLHPDGEHLRLLAPRQLGRPRRRRWLIRGGSNGRVEPLRRRGVHPHHRPPQLEAATTTHRSIAPPKLATNKRDRLYCTARTTSCSSNS